MTDQVPTKMRGWYLEEFGQPYVYKIDIPVSKPREDELLIKIKIAGYCHTETLVASVRLHLSCMFGFNRAR